MTPATRTPLHIPPCHQGHAYVSFGGVQGWDDSDWVPADYNIYLEASATLQGNASCLSDGSGCSISESSEVDCTMAGLFYYANASPAAVNKVHLLGSACYHFAPNYRMAGTWATNPGSAS